MIDRETNGQTGGMARVKKVNARPEVSTPTKK